MPDMPRSDPEQFYQGAPLLVGTRGYGVRDFSLRDPNGIVLVFGQDWD